MIFIFSPYPDLSPARVHAESDFISEAQKRMQSLVKKLHTKAKCLINKRRGEEKREEEEGGSTNVSV